MKRSTYLSLEGFSLNHKRRKDSLETRAEVAVLHTYIENQAILEPRLIFLPFYKIIVSFFSFLCQDANKTRSNCAIVGRNDDD